MGLVSTRLGLGLQINLYYQWRYYVGARGAIAPPVIAPPVFGFAPPLLHDATKKCRYEYGNRPSTSLVSIETLENQKCACTVNS